MKTVPYTGSRSRYLTDTEIAALLKPAPRSRYKQAVDMDVVVFPGSRPVPQLVSPVVPRSAPQATPQIGNKPNAIHNKLLGVTLTFIIALAAMQIATVPIIHELGISPLIVAIIIGIVFGNICQEIPAELKPGLTFSLKVLLRLAIILLGFRITFQQIAAVGWPGFFADAIMLVSTFAIAIIAGRYILNIDRDTTLLIGAGSSICGASAVLATESVLRANAEKAAIAVGTVTLFGTIAMFLYPFIFSLESFRFSEELYGVFTGATVHEVAQVAAAGFGVSDAAGQSAVVVKLVRVMMLAPVLIVLALFLHRRERQCNNSYQAGSIPIPWFVFGFIAVSGIYSLNIVPDDVVVRIQELDTFLLAVAMAALGVETKWSKVKKAGIKPIVLGLILFVWLLCGGLILTAGMHYLGAA